MPLTITRFAPENLTSVEVTKSLTTDPSRASYKLEYFDVSAVGSVPRDILAYGDAQWEDLPLTNWPAEVKAPFGLFPVLHIKTADGREVQIAESFVIDHYLAKQFGLLGDNEWEEILIKEFHSSSVFLRDRVALRVTWTYKEVQDKALDGFLKRELPLWIETHTKHLKDNGSNGHYVGNKLSLADIQTANVLDHLKCTYRGDEFIDQIKQASPEIWKVKETVDNEPRLQKWRHSEGYKKHIATSEAIAISPSTTHASGMLIILGILAAVTDAHPDTSSSSQDDVHPDFDDMYSQPRIPVKDEAKTQQEMLYYIALGMLVSQGLIRLITFISNRREKAALAAQKKDDDLAREKRKADLKTLADTTAPLLDSDTEDDDYEAESESESESEEEEEEEEVESEIDSESETEIQRRRRVLAAGDAEVEE
ncbi:hypothetical protein FBU30_008835 [Linnemannia zychae]|nr:hypothetical protein FBU30_008835 [Linnemannia zychae]